MIGLAWLSKSACDVTALGSVLTLDGKRRVALLLLVTFGGGLALVGLAKSLTARLRSDLLPQAAQIFVTSLPSSHATISAAVAVVGLTGVSRVHLGLQRPSDVVVGWALGMAWGWACWTVSCR